MQLTGRRAVVTGPAKGMGAAITLALAREGADLSLLGRDLAAIAPVAEAARALGRDVQIVACDIVDPASVEQAATTVLSSGPADILVNIAGGRGPFGKTGAETTPQEFREIMALNVDGVFLPMRAFLPAMIARRYGKIVNIGGTFGMRGRAGRVGYSASKWGMRGLTKSIALEVGEHNINVNSVCPGMVEGPRFDAVCADMAARLGITVDEARRRHAEDYALKRVSTGEDVANAVVFLASDKARQITGQDLIVDGGWVI